MLGDKSFKYITIDDCKHRHVYRIYSRNLRIGVYCEKEQGFVGIRVKWGSEYLFTEYHWDTGAPFGTVKPIEELGVLPENISLCEESKELFEYLHNIKNEIKRL